MIISAAPVAIPVTTANPPTEAVASEAAQKVPIPKSTPSAENPNTRNSTENHEQTKNTLDFDKIVEQENTREENSQEQKQGQDSSEKQGQQQQAQEQAQKEKAEQAQLAREIQQLKNIDREVRAHENAHANAGGTLAGAPQLSFVSGPDGKRYAVAGEVSIDTSKVAGDHRATIDKMRQVQRAALAPANPSPQDLKVAAIASQVASQAQVELNLERNQEDKLEKESEEQNSKYDIRFASPVAARRSSLQLNQKIVDSGAFEQLEEKSSFSQIA